jgi:hypothetical protein
MQYPTLSKMLFSIPNGGKRNVVEASIMKAEGTVSGVSDLILLVGNGRYSSLCIEMKHGKGAQSKNQKEWQAEAEKNGNKYVLCNSIDSFIKEIKDYFMGE